MMFFLVAKRVVVFGTRFVYVQNSTSTTRKGTETSLEKMRAFGIRSNGLNAKNIAFGNRPFPFLLENAKKIDGFESVQK